MVKVFFLLTLSLNVFSAEFVVQFNKNNLSLKDKSLLPLGTEYFKAAGNLYAKVNSNNAKNLKKLRHIKYVEPNYTFSAFNYENEEIVDPDFFKQWYLSNLGKNEPVRVNRMSPLQGKIGCDISAQKAWEISTGSKEIIIAIVDSGIDFTHPELAQNIWVNEAEKNGTAGVDDDNNGYIDDIHGYDFANNDSSPMDDNGHGTHCAGIIGAAHNNQKIMGVLKDVSLVAIKILDKKGHADTVTTIKGIEYALKTPAKILSCSWGGSDNSQILKELIAKAADQGVIMVAAAGNSRGRNNDTDPTFPASYNLDNVISIGAHNAQGYYSSFATRGPNSVHIAAPGTNIISTWPGGKFKVASGTSMAAPIAAAAVGLLKYRSPHLTPLEIRERLMQTGIKERSLKEKVISSARLDLLRLIED